MPIILLLWLTLLLAPILAGLLIFLGRSFSFITTRQILTSASLYMAAMFLSCMSNIGSASVLVTVALLCGLYIAYCLLVCGMFFLKVPHIRWPLLLLAMTPVAFGYLLVSFGGLALAFIIDDAVTAPTSVESAGKGLRCEIRPWRPPPADVPEDRSGYNVDVFDEWKPTSLRRRLVRLEVNETAGDAPRNCADGFRAVGKYGR
ncbi:hypothetical protein [Caulobacter sp. DWR3-1-2]|uniref:hypothetical protein n=1 Tax=Caulobacter sp. DWR3-1-2 TaxID=2804647 RepID=UPI003CE7E8DF